jgi:O-antigen ligase
MNKLIFWGQCATLILLPLPNGSNVEWAIFAFQCVTFVLFALHLANRFIYGKYQEDNEISQDSKLPLILKVLFLFFFGSAILQLIPLPYGLIRVLSPHSAAIHGSVTTAGAGGLAKSGWLTLSFAPGLSVVELARYFFYVLFAYLLFQYVRTRKQIRIIVMVMLLTAAFQAFYGLMDLFGGTEKILGVQQNFRLNSATGTYIDHDLFSGFLEMIFPLSLGYLLARANFFSQEKGLTFKKKIIWFSQEGLQKSLVFGLMSLIIGLGIFFSRSRSGIFVFFATIFLMVIVLSASGRKETRHSNIIWTVCLAVLFAVIVIGGKPIIERFSWTAIRTEERPTYYENTIKMIGDFPLSGTGFGTYAYAYQMYRKVFNYGFLDHAHDDYLELAAEGGLVSGCILIAAAFGLVGVLYSKWTQRKDHFVRGVTLGCMLGIVALLIHSLTYFNLHNPANAIYFLTLYALALRTAKVGPAGRCSPRATLPAIEQRAAKSRKSELRIIRKITGLGLVVLTVLLFALAETEYIGYRYFAKYQAASEKAKSNEISFKELEMDLKKAIQFYHNPRFYGGLGHLYLDRALAENKFGHGDQRDSYLDLAKASYSEQIKKNPIDSFAYYDLGHVYMLYNFPRRTYAEKCRQYCRTALELNPSDSHLNVNILYIYLTQWISLRPEEQGFLWGRLRDVLKYNENFIPRIVDLWRTNFGGTDRLKEIFSTSSLWPQLQKYF